MALTFATGLASSGKAQISDDVIKIGVMADMNGPLSTASGRARSKQPDGSGTIGWSVHGKPIEIISADHQNKPDIGAAIARHWFDVEHVDVIADLTNSAVGFAVVEVARPLNKIVLVSGPGSSDFTGKACAPTSIQWTWDTYAAATGSAQAIVGPDANTWFFIASDFAFGHALERDAASAVEKLGGKVVGRVWPPFNNSDFSSYLLQAQQSKASVIAFATAGQDTVNLVKQASEFKLAKPGTRVVPMQMMLDEVKAIGPELGQGDYATLAFHHDRSPEAKPGRAFLRADEGNANADLGRNLFGGAPLSAGRQGSGTDEPLAVLAKMRTTPVNDIFATRGYIREDGRMVHDMYLVQIKPLANSKIRGTS